MPRLRTRRRAPLLRLLLATAAAAITCVSVSTSASVGAHVPQVLVHEFSVSTVAARDDARKATLADNTVGDTKRVLTFGDDDDSNDDDDPVALTFAAAQLEAARLLGEYDVDTDAFLEDDDNDVSDAVLEEQEHRESNAGGSDAAEQITMTADHDGALHESEDAVNIHMEVEPVGTVAEIVEVVEASDLTDGDGETLELQVVDDAIDDVQLSSLAVVLSVADDLVDDRETVAADSDQAETAVAAPLLVAVERDNKDSGSDEDVADLIVSDQTAPRASGVFVRIHGVAFPDAPADVTSDAIEHSVHDEDGDDDERVDLEDTNDDVGDMSQGSASVESSAAESVLDDREALEDAMQPPASVDVPLLQDPAASCEQEPPAETLGPVSPAAASSGVTDVDDAIAINAATDSSSSSDTAATAPMALYAVESIDERVDEADVVDSQCTDDSVVWATASDSCQPATPVSSVEATEPHSVVSPNDSTDTAAITTTASSGFQAIVLEMAIAMEQIVYELRLGRRPHVPAALTAAAAHAHKSLRRYSSSVADPVADAAHSLAKLFTAANAEVAELIESALMSASELGKRLAHMLARWRHHAQVAFRAVSAWCWDVWATHEEVRVAGRNVRGLALLLLSGALFGSLYRVAAAVPAVVLAYFVSLDDVTRAQVKIFSTALLLLVVYHAHVFAWFWLLVAAVGAYYYWSGHVVISIEFK